MKVEGLSFRVNPHLKDDFAEFCEKAGISMSGAVNSLAATSIKMGKIPFVIRMVDYDMKKKEGKVSIRIFVRISDDVKNQFSQICRSAGLTMSSVVKMFMLQCVEGGRFPFEY